jgi:hypothetical protein
VDKVIRKKTPGKLSKIIILLHYSACALVTDLTEAALATVGGGITNHPPHNLDLSPSDLRLFGLLNVHQGGQKFLTDNGFKSSVLNRLGSWGNTFHAAGITKLPG